MKVIFWGTPEFSLPSLDALAAGPHPVAAVVTRPDRPRGRGGRVLPPPVKLRARQLGLPVFQPEKLTSPEFREKLAAAGGELMAVAAYGKYIPGGVVAQFPAAAINLHPSLLPRWRGAAPIQWALIEGDRETGVSVIRLTPELDAGEIFARERTPIGEREDYPSLCARLAEMGAAVLVKVVGEIERGGARAVPQAESEVTWAPAFTKSDALIDWKLSAARIDRLVRALNPWPGTHTFFPRASGRERVRILAVRPMPAEKGSPGTVLRAAGDLLEIAAGEGTVRVERLQPAGGGAMTAGEYLRGRRLRPGDRL